GELPNVRNGIATVTASPEAVRMHEDMIAEPERANRQHRVPGPGEQLEGRSRHGVVDQADLHMERFAVHQLGDAKHLAARGLHALG
ncbi:hypothetical protein P8631_20760, partial [Guyparkeria sp. 1SP6A2]|nr:hypothetical protein [Guyparkeria sp. 1SP6A2]